MLTVTKEKVLEAASKCETAKETLKVLFPEAFDSSLQEKVDSIKIDRGWWTYIRPTIISDNVIVVNLPNCNNVWTEYAFNWALRFCNAFEGWSISYDHNAGRDYSNFIYIVKH